MANENLKNALKTAGLTPEQFADILQVDPKSVNRWLAGTTKPYPRHRTKIASALGLAESDLWPADTVAPIGRAMSSDEIAASASELLRATGYVTDAGTSDVAALISESEGPIDLLENSLGFELEEVVLTAALGRARQGHRVRLLTAKPRPRLAPLIGHQHIEIAILDAPGHHSLIRSGETMLLFLDLPGEADLPSALIKLTRALNPRLFDRLADNLDSLWNGALGRLKDLHQLDAYLTNSDADDELEPVETNHDQADEPLTPEFRSARSTGIDEAPRRWPGSGR